jgi:hypothetical protein
VYTVQMLKKNLIEGGLLRKSLMIFSENGAKKRPNRGVKCLEARSKIIAQTSYRTKGASPNAILIGELDFEEDC